MSFLRPEARAALWRWREVLVGVGLMAIGLWWALTTIGLLHWLGYVLLVLAAAILAAGLQRARFRCAGSRSRSASKDTGGRCVPSGC
jgi:apolipoprotein N-acyltransferase